MAGGGVFATAAYVTYHIQRMENAHERQMRDRPAGGPSFAESPRRNERFDAVANCYDEYIGREEFFMGVNLLRRALLRFHARGTVLEVAAGTARNLPYYPPAAERIVLTDSSRQMLDRAKEKLVALKREQSKRFAFFQGDSASLDLPSRTFDTVVDTFGLCSYDDPVMVLNEMVRLCKPGGKILLLEHGRSKSWDFVTRHLDRHAEQHAANWGCVWNRDLDAVLDQVEGLEVETMRRFHFGTTYYVVCRPRGSKEESMS
jgi:methyltransferase OMS1